MLYKILYWKNRKKAQKRARQARKYGKSNQILRREVSRLRKRVAALEDGYVVEWCDSCNTQVTMLWNPETDGLLAFCPFCGSELLLCDSCHWICDRDIEAVECIGRKMSVRR